MTVPDTLALALGYARRGWPVFPLPRGAKTPATRGGFYAATRDESTIAEQWTRCPSRNVGIRTGAPSGLVVLDVDGETGAASLRDLEAEHVPLPTTRSVTTPSGGSHFYFRHPGSEVRCSAGKLGRGLDVRGDGGYVVAPPSRSSEHGRFYVLDADEEVAPLPAWLYVLMVRDARASADPSVAAFVVTPEGEGDGEDPHGESEDPGRAGGGNYLERLLRAYDDGRLDPEPVAGLPPLGPRAGRQQRALYDLLRVLFGIRLAEGVDDPLPLAGSVVADLLGLADEQSGRRLLDGLADRGLIWNHGRLAPAPGRREGTRTWLPGPRPVGPEPEHGWRVEPVEDPSEAEPAARPAAARSAAPPTPEGLTRRAVECARVGDRNATGAWLAQQLRDNRIRLADAEVAMRAYQRAVPDGDDPYTAAEAIGTVRSAYRSPPRAPWARSGRARPGPVPART